MEKKWKCREGKGKKWEEENKEEEVEKWTKDKWIERENEEVEKVQGKKGRRWRMSERWMNRRKKMVL